MEPGVLHSIAVIVHASVQLLVEINLKKWVFNVFVLFLHDNGMIMDLQRTFIDNGTGRDKTLNNNATTWSVRERGWIACAR